eukprot:CAMPEP_0197257326 /NCGR_PEP_ID=MMETSP1429-20130617/78310_1 /TAXON_ID=49237 /ORGANISM="Chaetoceros  sp., Strain UNC1202" /LENGTH=363 /DNA_ID=CAMNT_0042721133 /DNA_START=102 /DNA_END=1193 /DNA_ORIENTATION=+
MPINANPLAMANLQQQQHQQHASTNLDPNFFGTMNALNQQPIMNAGNMNMNGNAGITAGITANANSATNINASCLPLGQPLTVQDYPQPYTPVYNGVNPNYPNLQVLHQNPPIFAVPGFLTPTECDFLMCVSQDCLSPAPVVGKGAGEVSSSRTSSTCYLAREDLPEYTRKVSALTGKPVEHCELPQVGRYFPSQQYLQHFDAFDLSNEDGRRFASNGGQRTVTVLVYLNDVKRGGNTAFPALNLEVQPRKGMALIFFPATVDGLLDKNALHAAKPAIDTKYVSQVWIRQGPYEGVPSKRIFSSVEQASIVQKSLICAREGGGLNTNLMSNINLSPNDHNPRSFTGNSENNGNVTQNAHIAKQ